MSYGNVSDAVHLRNVEDLVIGLTYSLVSLLLCAVQLVMLYIFHIEEEFCRISAYLIMIHLGIADVVQLVFHAVSGFFVIFQSTFHFWFEKVWIALIWLYGCCFFVCYVSPAVTVTFEPSVYMWSHSGPLTKLVRDTEYYAALVELCITGTLYAAVVITLAFKVRGPVQRGNAAKRYEIRTLIQAMTISFFIGFVLFTWYNFDSYVEVTKWAFFVINMMWILNCGINPILYMLLNKTLRRKYVVFVKVYLLGYTVIADKEVMALCSAAGITHRSKQKNRRSSSTSRAGRSLVEWKDVGSIERCWKAERSEVKLYPYQYQTC